MTGNKRCALSLRCDGDGELGVASRSTKREFYGLHEKANTQHPPPDRKIGGGARRVPTELQSERAQPPVDPLDVRRRRRSSLGALPGGGEDARCDRARPSVATLGLWRLRQGGLKATYGGRRVRRSRGRRRVRARRLVRRRAPAPGIFEGVRVFSWARCLRRGARVVMRSVLGAPAARRWPEVGDGCGVWRQATRKLDESGRRRRGARL